MIGMAVARQACRLHCSIMSNLVHDNPARQRFELQAQGSVAFIDYRRDGNVVALTYAEVPHALRGGGIGSTLVRGTLLLARERGDRVIPVCSFVAAYVARHAEFRDLLADEPDRC